MKMRPDFSWYQDGLMFIGWLEDFPDYRTQGESLEELAENLADLESDLLSGEIPGVRRISDHTAD
jgi:hypothetical protein